MQYSLIENVTYCHFVQKTPQWQFGATCVNVHARIFMVTSTVFTTVLVFHIHVRGYYF